MNSWILSMGLYANFGIGSLCMFYRQKYTKHFWYDTLYMLYF
jgi:hypothetical protein